MDLLVLGALILVTVAVRLPGVFNRAIWYDEAITLLETAGNAVPQWSESPTPARTQHELMVGSATCAEITAGLAESDVHPPLYYLVLSKWRRLFGASIETARLLSVLSSLASVVLFYLLLRSSGSARPFAPALVYSLSSGAVHYAHEARNYSLALLMLLAGVYLAYLTTQIEPKNRRNLWMSSISIGLFLGLAFQTNYLTVFPVIFVLLWYLFWLPKGRRLESMLAILTAVSISLFAVTTLVGQLGARPKQFQKITSFGEELRKIFDFNFEMLWNPVVGSSGIQVAVIGALIVLAIVSLSYVNVAWKMIDRRLFSLMVGLAIVPSLGVLGLDLVFSKSLGKSSYVFFAGPAVVYLLTLATANQREEETATSDRPISPLTSVASWVLPFFVALQLTGINFDLERTPGFAGSSLRSLARQIEASGRSPVVVIGAGHGRGDPATVVYELDPETPVCVLNPDSDIAALSSELAVFEEIWIVFAKGRVTADTEQLLLENLTSSGGYRAVLHNNRIAHLKRAPGSGRHG